MPRPSFAQIDDISTVISILPVSIAEKKPGLIPGEYVIPAVKNPMKDINVLHVARARFPVYIDENRPALIVPCPSADVCMSIVRDFAVGLGGYEPGKAEPGLTWVQGVVSPEIIELEMAQEIKQLRDRQRLWFENLVALADDDWAKYRMRRMISTLQRVACSSLLLEREWNLKAEIQRQIDAEQVPCKFCRGPINKEAIVCQHCTGILDVARYKKEFVSAATLANVSPSEQKAPAQT